MIKDFLREKISFLKLWITFFIAIEVGSTAWLFNNFDKTGLYRNIAVIIAISTVFLIIIILSKKTYRLIKEMKLQEKISC